MSYGPIALAVIRGADGVVWICRDRAPSIGRWALPGGRIEPGEDPLEAARREAFEEVGLVLHGGRIIAIVDEHFVDDAGAFLYDIPVHVALFADPGDPIQPLDGVRETRRQPSPPIGTLEPDARMARLGDAPVRRIAARIRVEGDDLRVLRWEDTSGDAARTSDA